MAMATTNASHEFKFHGGATPASATARRQKLWQSTRFLDLAKEHVLAKLLPDALDDAPGNKVGIWQNDVHYLTLATASRTTPTSPLVQVYDLGCLALE